MFFNEFTDKVNENRKELRVIVLPVMPPRVSKINNKYRYRIIIKCKNNTAFRRIISQLLAEFGASGAYSDVTLFADMNPLTLV